MELAIKALLVGYILYAVLGAPLLCRSSRDRIRA